LAIEMTVSLREITSHTVREILALQVSEPQRDYVASNAVSIAEGHFNPGAWFRAIYAGELPVGFVMLFDPMAPGAIVRGPVEPTDIGLWRLMIDHRYQARGYGRAALDLVRLHVCSETQGSRLVSSYRLGQHGPEGFYLRHGFRRTGRLRANGAEIEFAIVV
jgi:diamine N-acetyltransferase